MPRPLSFDPIEKLSEATECFWASSYAEASISQLTEALKINKFSLYKQFGDKEQLYSLSLEYYNEHYYQPLLSPLRSLEGKASVLGYLDNFDTYIGGKTGQHGCFINNTLLAGPTLPESCRRDALAMAMDLRQLLLDNFNIAKEQNDLQLSPIDCVNFSTMTIQALLNIRRTMGAKAMKKNLSFFQDMIKSW